MRTLRFPLLGFLVGFLLASSASAQMATGTFQGYILNGVAQPVTGSDPNPPSIAGEEVTGSFQINLQPPLVLLGTASSAGAFYFDEFQPALAWSVSIPAQGFTSSLDGLELCATGVGLSRSATSQSADIRADADCGSQGFEMILSGAPDSLFSGIDPSTFHPGKVDLTNSLLIFGEKEGPVHFNAVFTQIDFTSPVAIISTAVPEAPISVLMCAGLALLTFLTLRRRQPVSLVGQT